MDSKWSMSLFILGSLMFAMPTRVMAHGIGVEAKLKGDRIFVEAFFDDDTPAIEAKVTVTSDEGKIVAAGKADAKGTWSFMAPIGGKYKVAVDAGSGHLAKTFITIPQLINQETSPPTQQSGPLTLNNTGEPEIVVSDGPTRAETTGWRRWMMAGIGLAVIGLITGILKFLTRSSNNIPNTETLP